ncbi:hypothetical protein PaG_04924 [Moesziomyces aphidis]|uniref:DNA replication complex GINS protein PSF2 n=1 Tax=Moesziomyces aphidis TaxID=84754 RepID=W3VJK6_MOEAP|nr:hypothetical protein PaG_04924 [Moesziomyces aphidis]
MSSAFASSSGSSVASTSVSVSTHARGLTATELELATTSLPSTSLTIVPLTSIDRVRLLSGIYGPFRPPSPATVPLWVALYLKKRRKAVIVPPTWLSVEALTETLKQETTQPGFSLLPHHWVGVSSSLLENAADDVPQSNRVRALLKDIREARQSKILAGVPMLNSVHLQMHNISAHEVAELRGFFSTAFSHLRSLRAPAEVEAETKLQAELDARTAYLLLPPLPARLDDSSALRAPSAPSARADWSLQATDQDESMRSELTDTSRYPESHAGPRKSNVSDSGYYSGPHAAASPDASRASDAPARPPRFDEDDDA